MTSKGLAFFQRVLLLSQINVPNAGWFYPPKKYIIEENWKNRNQFLSYAYHAYLLCANILQVSIETDYSVKSCLERYFATLKS